jgi:cell fate (sporulation/competence/biofilm development) regulator YlbF (YheA/YmcA/DUF963 family)
MEAVTHLEEFIKAQTDRLIEAIRESNEAKKPTTTKRKVGTTDDSK